MSDFNTATSTMRIGLCPYSEHCAWEKKLWQLLSVYSFFDRFYMRARLLFFVRFTFPTQRTLNQIFATRNREGLNKGASLGVLISYR